MAGNLTAMIASIFSGGVTADPYYEYTTLLLPGNGTNGAQNNTFLDSSSNNFTITRNGNTTQGTFSPFSQTGWSNYFVTAGNYLLGNSSTLGGTNVSTFTIDGWVYPTSFGSGADLKIIGDVTPSSFSDYISISLTSTGQIKLHWYDGGTKTCTTNSTVSLNSWGYFAVVVSSNTISIYINSSSASSLTGTTTLTTRAGTFNCCIAQFNGVSFPGYLSNIRVSTVARTISVPTLPFVSDANTRFLTCQSNRFVNDGAAGITVTPNGSPTVVAFSPFNPTASWSAATYGGSGYFDGSGDYLSVAHNAAFNLGSNDWCIEFFVYKLNSATSVLVTKRPNNGVAGYPTIFANTSNQIGIELGGATFTTASSLTLNAWTHIAVVKNGSGSANVKCYINGTADANTGTLSSAITSNTHALVLAGDTNGNQVTGYMSNFRMVNGSPVYTANFTPPTAPLTAITNTSLLLNFTNAGIYDATSKNDLETLDNTVNGVRISTAQSQFGGSSIYFDGTGTDYLWIQADQPIQRFGTAPFTIELWIRLAATGSARGLVAKGTSTTGWLVSLNTSNQVVFTYGTSTITSTGTISAGAWTYIAVVREGTGSNQTKIYIGGVNDGTGTVSTDFTQTSSMYIGADRTGGSLFSGYMQDVRITNGYARTVTTIPTTAFPVI